MSLKIDIIKKVLMVDTSQELYKILDVVGNAISRELAADDREQAEFKKWKKEKERESEESDEIRF